MATGQNSYNCQEDSCNNPVADSYLSFIDIYSLCQEEAVNMVFKKGNHPRTEFKKEHIPWNKGQKKVYSPEQLKKMSESHKGQIAWNKGISHSKETRQKMSQSHKAKVPWNKNKPSSEETRQKNSNANKGQIPWIKGKHHTKEAKLKMRKAKVGYIPWNKGKICPQLSECQRERRPSAETIKKLSESHKGKRQSEETKRKRANTIRGEKHPFYGKRGKELPWWRGGEKIVRARTKAKRRETLGFIPLNEWGANTPGFTGHHLDKEHVLYIPDNIHRKTFHRQNIQKSMDKINEIAISWYVNYYGLI